MKDSNEERMVVMALVRVVNEAQTWQDVLDATHALLNAQRIAHGMRCEREMMAANQGLGAVNAAALRSAVQGGLGGIFQAPKS